MNNKKIKIVKSVETVCSNSADGSLKKTQGS